MAINLEKGGRINLSKDNAELTKVRFGLSWKPNPFDTGEAFDLDASVFVCKPNAAGNPALVNDSYFVFYGNLNTPDGAVVHTGDSRTGDAADDDEVITVDLTKLNSEVTELSFIVTIHSADERKQNFGQVQGSSIKLYDDATGVEVAKYDLEDDFSSETAVQFGSLYKKDGHWLFKAVGAGFKKGLGDFVVAYGGNLG
jgi:tellurium resistance protein TerD